MSIQPLSNNGAPVYSPPIRNSAAQSGGIGDIGSTPTGTSTTAVASRPADPEAQGKALQEATQKANRAILGLGSDMRFSIDQDTGINVVKFIDDKTKEVIRQIPAQEMLDIAKRLDELKGLLIKERA